MSTIKILLLVNWDIKQNPFLELLLDCGQCSCSYTNWNLVVDLDCSIFEALVYQAWLPPEGLPKSDKTIPCTSCLVRVACRNWLMDNPGHTWLDSFVSLQCSVEEDELFDGKPVNSIQKFFLRPEEAVKSTHSPCCCTCRLFSKYCCAPPHTVMR